VDRIAFVVTLILGCVAKRWAASRKSGAKPTMWETVFGFSLAGAIVLLLSAALLARTIRSLDVSVHDRYMVILSSHLLLLSAVLFIATFAVWKARVVSH
jgi:hypothetical protein